MIAGIAAHNGSGCSDWHWQIPTPMIYVFVVVGVVLVGGVVFSVIKEKIERMRYDDHF